MYRVSQGRPTDIGLQAYSWARPAIFVAGNGMRVWGGGVGGEIFISSVFSLSFIFLFLPCPSLISTTICSISLLPFSGR